MIKLVKKNKMARIPVASRNVQKAFKQAIDSAKRGQWNHVIIIGEGVERAGSFRSSMFDSKALYMLEKCKHGIIQESFD